MHRVIVSPILAPCRARGSADVVRRSLVMHLRLLTVLAELFQCLQGLECVDTFPLFIPSNAYREDRELLSSGFRSPRETCGYMLVKRSFPFFGIILLMGRCDLGL